MGREASDVVAYADVTSSFGVKCRLEIPGGDIIKITISNHRNLSFGWEEKVRFRGEMVFYIM